MQAEHNEQVGQLREHVARCEQESLQAQENVRALQQLLSRLQDQVALKEREHQQVQLTVLVPPEQTEELREQEGGQSPTAGGSPHWQQEWGVANDEVVAQLRKQLVQAQEERDAVLDEAAEQGHRLEQVVAVHVAVAAHVAVHAGVL